MQTPVGVSDFKVLIEYKNPLTKEGYLYVDKSLFIKEIIGDGKPVIILTRPRRFGKTLNLSMLHYFFATEVKGHPTKGLFDHLTIAKESKCMEQQGQYPVIFITFKDAKYKTYDLCYEYIKKQITNVYSEYRFLLQGGRLTSEEQFLFKQILEGKAKQVDWHESLKSLTIFVEKVTGNQPIILIDEYDTPIQAAYLNGYYDDLIDFIRNLLSSSLKDNGSLKRAILTGILRVSKESLFSGLSNVKIYSVLHKKYSNYFGFTEEETNELLHKAQLPVYLEKTKEWYNGYNFGGTIIYNPWSIIEFINEGGKIGPYWINTSGNELIRELLIKSDFQTKEKISQLIAGNIIKETIDKHIVFKDLEKSAAAVWSLFLMTGYLKTITVNINDDGDEECELAIPNKEIESLYKRIVREWLSGSRGIIWYQNLWSALTHGKVIEFESSMQDMLMEMASYHDTGKNIQEIFYQGLMLGIICGLKDQYEIRANRESGIGRYDLALIPKDLKSLGIIMEFKAIDDQSNLIDEAEKALIQIKELQYDTELRARGVTNIYYMGIAFSGKLVKIVADHG